MVRLLTALIALVSFCIAVAEMECVGGNPQACDCLLTCKVFGGDSSQCSTTGDIKALIDGNLKNAMQEAGNECPGMQCLVSCAAKQQCLDDTVKKECMAVVQASNERCKIDCNGTFRGAFPSA